MRVCLLLGDQLSIEMSSLQHIDRDNDIVVMAEVADEASYVRHHKKKLILIFSAMRHFADALRESGYQVRYYRYGQHQFESLTAAVADTVLHLNAAIEKLVVTECGEHRLQSIIDSWPGSMELAGRNADLQVEVLEDTRFLVSKVEFSKWAQGRSALVMESFYRDRRRQTGLLMEADEPCGGKWNYDKQNRQGYDPDLDVPSPERFDPDETTLEVIDIVERHFADHFGSSDDFCFAVSTEQAKRAWKDFRNCRLEQFGTWQDAMANEEDFLFHAVCSMYINLGLLDPLQLCEDVDADYRSGRIALHTAEGFIRQIIGWREYIRGVYWHHGKSYGESNFFMARRDLPRFYWDGETKMGCMRSAIGNTINNAYAHHIQRLMVTGNFALLASIQPSQVCEWYLLVYADAYEWVELPNTHGMALFADGGTMSTKPYASSGKYINRMSNHCSNCFYKVSKTTGEGACPFNSLYWHFLIRHRDKLQQNHRMRMMYATLDRWDDDKREAIYDWAEHLLENIDSL